MPDDESFYGLGQHQSLEFNHKGLSEELFQYNTKISVPFVLSSRNYGILWDSYALSRWGNPQPYRQLGDIFRLYDKDGKEGSLTGTYKPAFGDSLVRQEDSLYFENEWAIKNLPDIRLMGAKVVYEGYLEAPETADYPLYCTMPVTRKSLSAERKSSRSAGERPGTLIHINLTSTSRKERRLRSESNGFRTEMSPIWDCVWPSLRRQKSAASFPYGQK